MQFRGGGWNGLERPPGQRPVGLGELERLASGRGPKNMGGQGGSIKMVGVLFARWVGSVCLFFGPPPPKKYICWIKVVLCVGVL